MRITIDDAYVEALGRVTYAFALLEWNAPTSRGRRLVMRANRRDRGFADSPLEGTGFEPSVPRRAPRVLVFRLSCAPYFRWREIKQRRHGLVLNLGRVERDRWFES